MKNKSTIAATLALLISSSACLAADWTSNSIGYRYAPATSEPGVSSKVSKNILSFTHVSGDKLGGNFFTIDLLNSSANDPANAGGKGAQEFYGIYQRSFSLSAMTGNKTGYGFAKDLSLTGRVEAGAKNTTFAPAPRKFSLGLEAAMPISAGFWNVGLSVVKESNYNGIVGKAVSFNAAPVLSSVWAIPVGSVGTFGGFASIVGPKGKDGFGAETKTETLLQAKFMFDVMGPKSGLTAGLGLEYWNNKFGCDNSKSFVKNSCNATTPLLLVEYKL